jgi:hypothetical protein
VTLVGGLRNAQARIGFAPFAAGTCTPASLLSVAVFNSTSGTVAIQPPLRTVTRYLVCYSVDAGATWQFQLLFFAVVCTSCASGAHWCRALMEGYHHSAGGDAHHRDRGADANAYLCWPQLYSCGAVFGGLGRDPAALPQGTLHTHSLSKRWDWHAKASPGLHHGGDRPDA